MISDPWLIYGSMAASLVTVAVLSRGIGAAMGIVLRGAR